jgi:hypothetical protein
MHEDWIQMNEEVTGEKGIITIQNPKSPQNLQPVAFH